MTVDKRVQCLRHAVDYAVTATTQQYELRCLACDQAFTPKDEVLLTVHTISHPDGGVGYVGMGVFCAAHAPQTPAENQAVLAKMLAWAAETTQPKEPWQE